MLLKITNDLVSETDELNNSNQIESINIDDHSNVKNGVKLPKTSDQWVTAESFFKAELPTHEIGKDNLDLITQNTVQKLSDTIYDYFGREFGSVVNTSDTKFKDKYKDFPKHQLIKAPKTLKCKTTLLEFDL